MYRRVPVTGPPVGAGAEQLRGHGHERHQQHQAHVAARRQVRAVHRARHRPARPQLGLLPAAFERRRRRYVINRTNLYRHNNYNLTSDILYKNIAQHRCFSTPIT